MNFAEIYFDLLKRYSDTESIADITHTAKRMHDIFEQHSRILISYSGGSDSDCIVHFVCKYFPEHLEKCHFVFCNTGLEYEATKRHIKETEKRYGIHIVEVRGKSIPFVVKKYGLPILSKAKSQLINAYCRNVPWAVKYANGESKSHKFTLSKRQKELCKYVQEHGILISDKCCTLSKKQPIKDYIIKHGITLNVTGEREAEGGIRAMRQHSCYSEKSVCSKFMPLYWWSDRTKQIYKDSEGILFSDCYEIWGMQRTGCVGCPFNRHYKRDLAVIKKFEPQLFNACLNVFGTAYALTEKFNANSYGTKLDKIE